MEQDLNNNYEEIDNSRDNLENVREGTNIFKGKCEDCGNMFITQSRLNECIICKSTRVVEENYVGELDSLLIIPFSKTRDEAIKNYKKKVFWNPLVPFVFKKKENINLMQKVFVKVTNMNLKVSGETSFNALDKDNISKKESSDKKYKVILSSNFDYENVLISNIFKIDDNLFAEIADYNFSSLNNYDNSYLSGETMIVANDGKIEEDKIENDALKCSLNVIKDNIRHDLKKLDKNDLVVNINSKKDVLIPVYILNIKYKEKDYFYLMNGVSGKDVLDFTIGKLELVLFCIVFFLLVFGIAFLVAYFL